MSKNKMNWKQYRKWVEYMKTTELWKKKKYLRDFGITDYEVKDPFNKCLECKKECKTLWADGPDYFGETNWCDKCLDCAYKYVKKLEIRDE